MSKCIICGSSTKIIERYSSEEIALGYKHHFKKVPEGLFDKEYSMRICKKCKLIFADPLEEGNNKYYEWVTKQEGYYAADRWEWHVISEYLNKLNREVKVLEVGCGSGCFLDFLKKNSPNAKTVGVDITENSVKQCKEKGHNAFCGTLEDYLKIYPKEKYDFVMSFHCLEHVVNPREYIAEMINICKTGGLCINAIPYTSILEQPWWDVLNSPPHHMTRWSISAIEELGYQVGCKVELMGQNNFNVWNESFSMLNRIFYPLYDQPQGRRVYEVAWKHPILFLRELFRNVKREKIVYSESLDGASKKKKAPYHITMIMRKSNSIG